MGLINKIIYGGLAVAGLSVAPACLAVDIPVFVNTYKDSVKLMDDEAQSKLVCVLSEKLATEMEKLNSTTLEVGNCVADFSQQEKLTRYENYYDKAIGELRKFEMSAPISKSEFVNYMMKHGEELENYINSSEYNAKLAELKAILQDEAQTPEERLQLLKESVNSDYDFMSAERKSKGILFTVMVILMIVHSLSLVCSIGDFVNRCNSFDFKTLLLGGATMLFGLPTINNIYEISCEDYD